MNLSDHRIIKTGVNILQNTPFVFNLNNKSKQFNSETTRGCIRTKISIVCDVKILTNLLIFLDHLSFFLKCPKPTDFLLQLFGQEQMDLVCVSVGQFEGVFYANVKIIISAIDCVNDLITIHINPTLIVENITANEILWKAERLSEYVCNPDRLLIE